MFDRLDPISLEQLLAEAAFLTRVDRKYVIPIDALPSLVAELDPVTQVLEIDGHRCFGYLTPYFDDHAFSAYHRAARRRPSRFKVRTRLYTNSGIRMLEVKVRDARGRTVKHRLDHTAPDLDTLTRIERAWLSTFPQIAELAGHLHHCVTTHYQRTTLLLPDAAGRVTIDRKLSFSQPNGSAIAVPHIAIIETKSASGATAVDRLLWRHGYRPLAISKFTSGLSLLNPELPANRWHRLHRRLTEPSRDPDPGTDPGALP